MFFDGLRFHLGQQVHRPDFVAFPLEFFDALADLVFGLDAEVGGRFRQVGIDAQPFQDAFRDRAPGVVSLLDSAFRPDGVFPPASERGFRGAGGPVGFRGTRQRCVQRRGRTAMERFGVLQGFQSVRPLHRDSGRGGFECGVFGLGFVPPSREVGDAFAGIACSFGPSDALRRDGAAPLHAGGAFPDQCIAFGARGGFGGAGGG